MAINPDNIDITTIPNLPTGAFALANYIAQSDGSGVMSKNTQSAFAAFIAPYVSSVGASGFIPTNGNTLPAASNNRYTFVSSGTFSQTTGGNVVTTAPLNILVSNATTWSLVTPIQLSLDEYLTKEDGSVYELLSPSFTNGQWTYADGGIGSSANLKFATITNIPESRKIKVTNTFFGGAIPLAVYKNSSNTVIGSQQQGSESTPNINLDFELTIPDSATTVIINGQSNAPFNIYSKTFNYASATEVKQLKINTQNFIENPVQIVKGSYINPSGSVVTFVDYKYGLYEIPQSRRIKVTSRFIGSDLRLAIYLDIRKNVIGVEGPGGESAYNDYKDFELTIPANAFYVYINGKGLSPIIVKNLKSFIAKPAPVNYFSGKNILFFSDSFGERQRIPISMISSLGGNLINYSLSSSRIANKSGDTVDSFATRVDSMPTGWDFAVLLGGTNDDLGDVPLGDISSTSTSTFYGAFKYVIQKMNEKAYDSVNNKYGTIIVVTPTCNYKGVASIKKYSDAMKAVCENNATPIFNYTETSGLNDYNITTLKSVDQIHEDEDFEFITGSRIAGFVSQFIKLRS